MARPSKIRRLPKELQERLQAMLAAGHTLDEITAHLKSLGADVSRSGIGRYALQQEKILENVRRSREAAEAIVGRFGEGADEGRLGRALTQMVQSLAFDYIQRRVDDPDALLDLDEIYKLARAVRQSTMAVAGQAAGRAGREQEKAAESRISWAENPTENPDEVGHV